MSGRMYLLAVTTLGAVIASALLEPTEVPDVYLGAKARRRLRRYLASRWPDQPLHFAFRVSRATPPTYTAIDAETLAAINESTPNDAALVAA